MTLISICPCISWPFTGEKLVQKSCPRLIQGSKTETEIKKSLGQIFQVTIVYLKENSNPARNKKNLFFWVQKGVVLYKGSTYTRGKRRYFDVNCIIQTFSTTNEIAYLFYGNWVASLWSIHHDLGHIAPRMYAMSFHCLHQRHKCTHQSQPRLVYYVEHWVISWTSTHPAKDHTYPQRHCQCYQKKCCCGRQLCKACCLWMQFIVIFYFI